MYVTRLLERPLEKMRHLFPALVITGPRQSGKSTLLQHVFADHQYVTFDDPSAVAFFDEDPVAFLEACPGPTAFDEVQRVPQLLDR